MVWHQAQSDRDDVVTSAEDRKYCIVDQIIFEIVKDIESVDASLVDMVQLVVDKASPPGFAVFNVHFSCKIMPQSLNGLSEKEKSHVKKMQNLSKIEKSARSSYYEIYLRVCVNICQLVFYVFFVAHPNATVKC